MEPVWIFDCDNTLYSAHTGFFARVDARIIEYMVRKLSIPEGEIGDLRRRYRENYSITLVGLMREYSVEPMDYLDFVHDVELDDLVSPDERLRRALSALPGEKHVFTNGTASHAGRVLERLGIRREIGTIFDIGFMDYVPKPEAHGYRKMLDALGAAPESCVMVDDMIRNLDTARELGMATVLVGDAPAGEHPAVRAAWMVSELNSPLSAGEVRRPSPPP